MKRIGIFGTSGFAREVRDIALESGYQVTFIAKDATEAMKSGLGPDVMIESDLNQATDMVYAIGIGENAIRERVFEKFASRLNFVSLVHPSATFGLEQRSAVEKQPGVIVCAGVRMTNSIQIEPGVVFNLNVTIGHDSIIGRFANLAPGANISGNVHIGDRCWIGTGAAIIQGREGGMLNVGDDAVIGAGAVVTKDCDAGGVYVGVPAKRIK